jgi:hypothetical protein
MVLEEVRITTRAAIAPPTASATERNPKRA